MSTLAYVDSKTITQANGAQSSRVPVLLPDDPYVAVRQSKPEEAPSEADELQPLGSRVPLMDEDFKASEPLGTRTISSHSLASSDSTTPLSPHHPLTQALPIPTSTELHSTVGQHIQPSVKGIDPLTRHHHHDPSGAEEVSGYL
ncbi:hypothetical protein Tco_0239402 [Tanacetum coccineum]